MESSNTDKPNETPNLPPLEKNLMGISDITLGAIISVFFQHCNPPQRKYPIENGEKPVWWPENESYKEPNNLKKKSKVNVLAAIIEHLSPNFSKMEKVVRKSKSLEKTMSSLEVHVWYSIMANLRKGSDTSHIKQNSTASPSHERRDKEKGLLQEPPQGENEKSARELSDIDPMGNLEARGNNRGGSVSTSLLNVNHLSENSSVQNNLRGLEIETTNGPNNCSNDLLDSDQKFWQFMNNQK